MRCSLLTLSCYIDDELDARKRGEMEAHLVACARCRGGLTHLKEEMGRLGALAPVTVPDGSARALMEAVGVLAPGAELPPRTTPRSFATDDDVPPWLAGQVGPALPWTAPPRQPRALSVVHEEATIHLHGTTTPLRRDEFGGVPAVPFDMEHLRAAPPVVLRPGAPSPPGTAADSASTPAGDEDASPASPADRRTETPPPPPSTPPLPPLPFDPLRRERLLSGLVGIDSAPRTPAWWAPNEPEPAADPPDLPSAAGDSEVAVRTSEPPAGAPAAPEYPMTDDDVLDEPEPVEHLGGPMLAPKPSLFERFKERIAVRRALSGAFHDDYDDSVEVVSGTGAPLRPHGRAELGRRRSEALRPAEPMAAVVPPRPPAMMPDHAAPATRRDPGLREVLAPPARPSSLEPLRPTRQPTAGITTSSRGIVEVETVSSRSGRDPWSLLTPLPDEAPARVPRGRELSPAEVRDGRRVLTMVVGGLAAVMVVGLVSGRVTTPIPSPISTATQPATGTTAQAPVAPPVSQQQQSTAAAPQASAAAPAPASQQPAPAPAPAQPAAPVTIGSGGTGWMVGDFRYGGHPTFYRVVIDLGPAGAAAPSASPTVTVANEDATHILVTLDGTAPADSAPTPPAQSGISSIQLVSNAHAGSTVYRFTLTHAASAHASLIPGPMRLILDIS